MAILVVGIGADGLDGLADDVRARVLAADVVLGGERHLQLLPSADQTRLPWPKPLRDALPALLAEHADQRVVALASGDPLVAGIGTTLVELLGADAVEVVPHVSSASLVRARMGWPDETVVVVRDPGTVVRHLAPRRRIVVLSTNAATPSHLARTLTEHGHGDAFLTVLGDLGATTESRRDTTAAQWSGDAPALHVLAIELRDGPSYGVGPGLPDDAFDHDGQLTKRDVRASALAHLAPRPGELLWDVGAGAGSVAIEWSRSHATCRAIAIEAREDRAKRIDDNAARLGVPSLRVVLGHAPEALDVLPRPDAIFVGGGATEPGVLDACWDVLAPGGRLVVHGVTLETEAVLAQRYREHGGELTRLHVEHASPIGSFTGWTPSRAVTQWSVTR